MADMIAAGSSWLAGQLSAHASVTCAYKRGANTTQFLATIGRSQFEAANQNGVLENWESRDYIVRTEALPFGKPNRGDIIVQELNGTPTFYEVSAPTNLPVFHFADAAQTMVRIHTRQLDKDQTFIITDQGEIIIVPLVA